MKKTTAETAVITPTDTTPTQPVRIIVNSGKRIQHTGPGQTKKVSNKLIRRINRRGAFKLKSSTGRDLHTLGQERVKK